MTIEDPGPNATKAAADDALWLETERDYFAAAASQGAADVLCDMLTPEDVNEAYDPVQALQTAKRHARLHAMAAYIYADAMLEARKK